MFVGDMVHVAIPDLRWQHVVSIQFALQYAFACEEHARAFLRHSLSQLCIGGILICTTVDDVSIGHLAGRALNQKHQADSTYAFGNELFRVTFPGQDVAEQVRDRAATFGLRYHFAMWGGHRLRRVRRAQQPAEAAATRARCRARRGGALRTSRASERRGR